MNSLARTNIFDQMYEPLLGLHRVRNALDFPGGALSDDIYVSSDDEKTTVQFVAPGLGDIEVETEDTTLKVSGETSLPAGKFERSVRLTRDLDPSGATASYSKGILTVTIPKNENARPKKIEVQISD